MKNYNDIYDKKQRMCAMVDEAYSKGYDTACDDCETAIEDSYQKGLDDAWECAKKIAAQPSDGGFSATQLITIFNQGYVAGIVSKYSASEAIAKIREYEEKQKADEAKKKDDEEIKVGDEVIIGPGLSQISSGIVTRVPTKDFKKYSVMWQDGSVGDWTASDLQKTGKHYNIQGILNQMKR